MLQRGPYAKADPEFPKDIPPGLGSHSALRAPRGRCVVKGITGI